MTPERFELTQDHITLLRHSFVQSRLSDVETGAAEIDGKHPYGNSNVAVDVAELLGWEFDSDEELPDEVYDQAMEIHAETPIALQIVLFTGAFEPGNYYRPEKYDTLRWERE